MLLEVEQTASNFQILRGQLHMLESLFVRADTWEGGGYAVYIKCSTFLAVLGYAVGYSYGELMMAAHRHLPGADWSAIIAIDFRDGLEINSDMDELVQEIGRALRDSGFHQRECHIRVIGHRLGDTLASLVGRCDHCDLSVARLHLWELDCRYNGCNR